MAPELTTNGALGTEGAGHASIDPCIFYGTKNGCPNGEKCSFSHRLWDSQSRAGVRPRKDRRSKIKERIWIYFISSTMDEMVEGLQDEARRHPYARDVLKGYIDRLCPHRAQDGGVVFSL
eukprot:Skav233503  [mRNA]  locus=scaffold2687:251505:263116:- [translate_table: standard]